MFNKNSVFLILFTVIRISEPTLKFHKLCSHQNIFDG